MEKLLGIHRGKKLPDFAAETFDKWLRRDPLPKSPTEPSAKVVLFPTCFVNYYDPGPGKAAVEVFAKNGCAVACPKQNCCGMPALDGGDVAFAQKQARANVDSMLPLVRQGYKIAAINPTCSLTMRARVSAACSPATRSRSSPRQWSIRTSCSTSCRAGQVQSRVSLHAGTIAYHFPCHLKAQNIGLSLARPDAHDSRRRGHDGRCVHGA